ncbi:MAG: hypothetical protein ACRC2T_05200 [Thermoguttaceae bacterium]
MDKSKPKIGYHISYIHTIDDPLDDNIDVVVYLDDGRAFGVTFYTLKNISTLMKKWSKTGECLDGLFFTGVDCIILNYLDKDTIERVISYLIEDFEDGLLDRFTKVRTDY